MPMNHQMQDLMKMLTLQVIILLFFEMTVINQIWILYISFFEMILNKQLFFFSWLAYTIPAIGGWRSEMFGEQLLFRCCARCPALPNNSWHMQSNQRWTIQTTSMKVAFNYLCHFIFNYNKITASKKMQKKLFQCITQHC